MTQAELKVKMHQAIFKKTTTLTHVSAEDDCSDVAILFAIDVLSEMMSDTRHDSYDVQHFCSLKIEQLKNSLTNK